MKKTKMLLQTCAAALALMASAQAFATYSCAGKVSSVVVSPSGVVTMTSAEAGLTAVYLCQVGATYNGVTSDACKSILAVLLAAQAQQKSVSLVFNDALTCTTHPSWSDLTGWYFGPELQQ